MTLFYGIVLLVGIALAGVWITRIAISQSVDGHESANPERRWGETGRMTIAGLIGFAMGGFAVLYTDLPPALSIAAAIVGGAAMAAMARWLGPTPAP